MQSNGLAATSSSRHHEFRVVLRGEPQVGKTSLLNRLLSSQELEEATYYYSVRVCLWGETKFPIRFLDTSGSEEHRKEVRHHTLGFNPHLLVWVYDAMDKMTLELLENEMQLLRASNQALLERTENVVLGLEYHNYSQASEKFKVPYEKAEEASKIVSGKLYQVSIDNSDFFKSLLQFYLTKHLQQQKQQKQEEELCRQNQDSCDNCQCKTF